MKNSLRQAKLILEDGSVFIGHAFGAKKSSAGEVVFNTGMVGYPETMSDPSYKGQILCFTYPLIGNYGVPGNSREDGILMNFESDRIDLKGIIISDYSQKFSHHAATGSLEDWMKEHSVPGICGIDTRELTKKIRSQGTMLGKIIVEDEMDFFDPSRENLVSEVSIRKPVTYKRGKKTVLLVDCGCKNSIIKNLLLRDVTVIRVPWDYDFHDSRYDFDGILVSNGPGDPKICTSTIENLKKEIEKKNPKPILGICLGNQILALASGADTYKLKYGHRSQNQPCVETGTKRCFITSQNHGYAVRKESLQAGWQEWFHNLNDGSNEGIRHTKKPFLGAQFHPEATAGPIDTAFIFDDFVRLL